MRLFGGGTSNPTGRSRVPAGLALTLTAAASVLSAGVWQRTRSIDAELQHLRGQLAQEGVARRVQAALPSAARPAVEGAAVRLPDHNVNDLRAQLAEARERLAVLEAERTVGETVIRRYGAGVCLIQGAYGFSAPDNSPLRMKMERPAGEGKEGALAEDAENEGEGEVHVVEYYGTGFLVDESGLVLSNRHIAEPWWNDDTAEELLKRGFKPRFIRLRAFFPNEAEAFELTARAISPSVDLAVLQVDLRGRRIPALPLAETEGDAVAGRPILVLGYPTGLEAIMAKSEEGVVRTILDAHGTSRDQVTEALSLRGLIRPSATQGHIGDITDSDIVFDAPTTQGGSGGPIFNRDGRVIAVEYAVLPQFGGNSFGVPISFARDLLRVVRDPAVTAD
jgi:serine protease Do